MAGGNTAEDLAAFGLPASLAKSLEEAPCEVWKCNWKTLQLFLAMETQWRAGMGGATGLDYTALPVVAKAKGIKITAARLDGLRVMEGEALRLMAEERKKRAMRR